MSTTEIAILLCIAVLLVAGMLSSRSPKSVTSERLTIQIEAGDTLWSIAREHPVDGLTTAQIVETIAAVNGIESGIMSPGQTITIPSQPAEDRVAMR